MTNCKNCEILRKKLSPLESKSFTAKYTSNEPIQYYLDNITHVRRGRSVHRVIRITAKGAFWASFGREPRTGEVTLMGRTLRALGFEQTRQLGYVFYSMPCEEAEEIYGLKANYTI